jgi:hypothetical protein
MGVPQQSDAWRPLPLPSSRLMVCASVFRGVHGWSGVPRPVSPAKATLSDPRGFLGRPSDLTSEPTPDVLRKISRQSLTELNLVESLSMSADAR